MTAIVLLAVACVFLTVAAYRLGRWAANRHHGRVFADAIESWFTERR